MWYSWWLGRDPPPPLPLSWDWMYEWPLMFVAPPLWLLVKCRGWLLFIEWLRGWAELKFEFVNWRGGKGWSAANGETLNTRLMPGG